jgi:hypothetical protein
MHCVSAEAKEIFEGREVVSVCGDTDRGTGRLPTFFLGWQPLGKAKELRSGGVA